MEKLGERIREILRVRKMTQQQLAEKIHMTETSISRYIGGERTPSSATITRIADALGTSTDYLLRGTEKNPKEEKLRAIIAHYGEEEQKLKAIEELTELQEALIKDSIKGGFEYAIAEEIADVYVMLAQLKIIYGFSEDKIEEIKDYKITRTIERMSGETK